MNEQQSPQTPTTPDESLALHGNPLVAAAETILLTVAMLAHNARPASASRLQRQFLDALDDFTDQIGQSAPQWLDDARYALCALVDETLLNTRWGATDWVPLSLLGRVYNENFSGDAFFDRLEKASAGRQANLPLLEFFHLCLSLGYSGRYQRRRYTDTAVQQVRTQLAALIAQYGPAPPNLSPPLPQRPQGSRPQRLPLWVAAAFLAALLLAVHQGLTGYLASHSSPLVNEIQQLLRQVDRQPADPTT